MINLYVALIYLVAAIPLAWLGLYAWRKRPAVAVTPFAWAMLAVSVWTFAYSLELSFPTLPAKLLLVRLEYPAVVAVPVFLLFFALEFTGKSHLLTPRLRLLIWGIPLLTLFLVWTNDSHHLMWDTETITSTNGLNLLTVRFGVFFWVHTVYSYFLTGYASILLILELIQRPRIYRIQISFVVLGILIPMIGNLMLVSGGGPIRNLDVTPLFFLPAALGLSWAVVKYRLLEVLPPEHLSVLQGMKDGVILLNAGQRILYINPVAEELFQLTEDDAIGQPLERISEEYAKKLAPHLNGKENRVEIMLGEGKQAKVYELTVSPSSEMYQSRNQVSTESILTLHDITERKEMELALTRRESIMAAISLAAERFLKESAWELNIAEVLEKIGQAVNVSHVFVIRNYKDGQNAIHSSLSYEWASPGEQPQMKNPALHHVSLRHAGFARWEDTLSKGSSIYGKTREFPPEELPLFQTMGSLSVAATPIFVDSQWWGFIMFDECRQERDWTATELQALHTAASIFGSAEARARTENKLIRRQRTLNLLHEIVAVSLQAENVNDMAQTVVNRLGELIKADGCFLTHWDETTKRVMSLAAYGPYKDKYISLIPQPGERTFTESALMLGHTLVIDDTKTTTYADPRIAQNFPAVSLLVLPMKVINKNLGSVLLAFNRLHQFQPEEISISEQATALIALALEKFQALEKVQRRADTSETLRKAGSAVIEVRKMADIVNRILEQLHHVVPYDSASVQLLDGDELEIVGGRGWENAEDVIGLRFHIPGDNPNSVVVETGKPYHLPETWKVYKAFLSPPHNHIRSWLGVPLIVHEKTIGLLAVDSSEPNHFTEDDLIVAAEFAKQVAIALENARIFQETENQAITDPLTGLYNRRGLFELGKVEFARSQRLNRPFSAIMLDLDHFKQVNDTYGHSVGDLVLCEFANRCKSCIREIDYIGRYGGEEIIILLPDTDIKASLNVAERVRAAIVGTPIHINGDQDLTITASLGVASKDEHTLTLDMLIARADQAMYVAKHKGRNRVAVSR